MSCVCCLRINWVVRAQQLATFLTFLIVHGIFVYRRYTVQVLVFSVHPSNIPGSCFNLNLNGWICFGLSIPIIHIFIWEQCLACDKRAWNIDSFLQQDHVIDYSLPLTVLVWCKCSLKLNGIGNIFDMIKMTVSKGRSKSCKMYATRQQTMKNRIIHRQLNTKNNLPTLEEIHFPSKPHMACWQFGIQFVMPAKWDGLLVQDRCKRGMLDSRCYAARYVCFWWSSFTLSN